MRRSAAPMDIPRRRSEGRSNPLAQRISVGELEIDPLARTVRRSGRKLELKPREYRLLELLMRNSGRVISRDSILESVWGFSSEVNENTLEVFMRLLRVKIDHREPKLIHTVRGAGYMMREP